MKYDAITLDTSIFDRNRLVLDAGMLKQMEQFKEGPVDFVLSEIVIREVHRHLRLKAERASLALEEAIAKIEASGILSEPHLIALNDALAAADPKHAAKDRLKDFMDQTGLLVVPADDGSMKRLIKMYFDIEAPFEDSEKKKNEFPDAIALMTLEDWARKNGKKLLAISGDGGWKRFADNSEWIDVQDDLAAALQELQQHAADAQTFVADLLTKMESGEAADRLEFIQGQVESQVSDLSPMSEGSTAYYYDAEQAELAYHDMTFLRDGDDFDFYVVQIGRDKIVARVGVNIKAQAQAHFVFQVKDEGDYIRMGDCLAEKEFDFEAGILITIFGEFAKRPPEFEIEKVELVDAIASVDFGSVEIDWDPDDRYDTEW